MPRPNRVDPFGEIHTVPQRGTFMGNRGNLHSATGEILRSYKRKQWVTCLLEYRGRHRQIMEPGGYTELFFLDEATSLAAGHRPCGTCRREALERFRSCWARSSGELSSQAVDLKRIDAVLHSQRLHREYEQIHLLDLPDGVFVCRNTEDGRVYLWWRGKLLEWSFDGYRNSPIIGDSTNVHLITPTCLVGVLKAGYPVSVHKSAEA